MAISGKQPSQMQLQQLIQLINQNQLAQAETMANQLIQQAGQLFILHNLLGIALDGQGKSQQAVSAYRKAISLQGNVADLHFNLAIALSNLHQYDEAITCYQRALQLDKNMFQAYGNIGTLYQKQGKLAQAIEFYRKALSIQQDALGYFNLGTALRDEGQLDEAIDSYQQAIRLFPNYADAYCNLGETLRDRGDMQQAVDHYQQALVLNPDHASANYNMAEFLYLAKRFDEAVQFFERSQLDDWLERSMMCLYKAQRFEEFKQRLDKIVQSGKHIAPFMATLSTHYAINFGQPDPYNFCKNGLDFVYHASIPELAQADSPLLKALLQDINHSEIAERVQGMLHNGKQSAGNLFKRPEASFRQLAELVKQQFLAYRDKFAGADCELIKSFPQQLEFTSSWYVKMRQGGHLDPHIHEIGWISGAVYLAMPKNKQSPEEGAFEYGTHGDHYPQMHENFPVAHVVPQVGDIVLFPSSLFHRTIPFSSDEERICIAFDLKPDQPNHARSLY